MTGQVPAHAMTKAERSYRSRENQRRITLKLPALPKPDTTQDCPRCHGKGTIPASSEVTGMVTLTVPEP